jgi:hypothetical protein
MTAWVLGEQLNSGPDALLVLHRIDRMEGDHARVTYAPPVVLEVSLLGEHTDFSGITVLFNQLGSLQMLNFKDAETLHQTRGTEGVGQGN